MNPHPPYAAKVKIGTDTVDNPDFYKNAVSGDFDLFAFWPAIAKPASDLVRLSETSLGTDLKCSFYPSVRFCLEFIPGFGELVDANKENLKESAEEGNIHDLGRWVAGLLNNYATTFYNKYYKQDVQTGPALNKAFHSDEGGRPGIMEVEFPIAFFSPKSRQTPAVAPNVRGRLVKNPTELLKLMHASANAGYVVVMHSEWMIHLFYISMPAATRTAFLATKQDLAKVGEFKKLEHHHAEMYAPGTFVEAVFAASLKALLRVSDDTFVKLQLKFLELAFQGDRRAIDRQLDIRQVLAGYVPMTLPAATPLA